MRPSYALATACLSLLVSGVSANRAWKSHVSAGRKVSTSDNEPGVQKFNIKLPTIDNNVRSTSDEKSRPAKYIVNGQEVTDWSVSYQVGIIIDNGAFCGGSLIAKDKVLTAAHCCSGFSQWAVYLGTRILPFNTQDNTTVIIVSKKCVVHEKYNATTLINDIAIITLVPPLNQSQIDTGRISITPLVQTNVNYIGSKCKVSGWGLDKSIQDGGKLLDKLNYVYLDIFPFSVCEKAYTLSKDYKIICAGDASKRNQSTCQGDSGGPLVCTNPNTGVTEQVGVVSFGAYSCTKNAPLGFTSVISYASWIETQKNSKTQSTSGKNQGASGGKASNKKNVNEKTG